ncbi:stress protein [Streptomyces sp. 549]|uniref:stress protein n=1 Tax=Streptomyces sp. 549 TaxID=3049076 RepID=UPI0024C20F02|nr:stress protein [Streptomyces sp. 549]MDK1472916.1 stress protein [Streptomyces sp. 549]
MNRQNLKTSLVAVPLVTAALLGTAALPAHAASPAATTATAVAEQSVSVAADAPKPRVIIHTDKGANGVQVANAISNIREKNRGKFVEKARDAAFEKSGKRYNVVIINLAQKHKENLNTVRLYANVQYGGIYYGLYIAETGTFTNQGDGGYINWAFRGWYKRNGMTVTFRRP